MFTISNSVRSYDCSLVCVDLQTIYAMSLAIAFKYCRYAIISIQNSDQTGIEYFGDKHILQQQDILSRIIRGMTK